MALFKVGRHQDSFTVIHHADRLELPRVGVGSVVHAKIWSDDVDVIEPSKEASGWFSSRMGISCRLVLFPEVNPRAIDPKFRIGTGT